MPSRHNAKRKAAESPDTGSATNAQKRSRENMPVGLLQETQEAQYLVEPDPQAPRPLQAVQKKLTNRVINFDEIYQDGKATYKHKIFEYKEGSGNWYIVKCDEHNIHFGFNNPVQGAAKHLHSPQHAKLERRHDLAIEKCGFLVKDCTAEIAKKNNDVFKEALKQGYKILNSNRKKTEGQPSTAGPSNLDRDGSKPANSAAQMKQGELHEITPIDSVVQPQAGKFYQGFWQSNKKWYPLIVLPIQLDGSLSSVGIQEKLHKTDLFQQIPKCYRVNQACLQIEGWQPAYQDNGPKVKSREFPVMFFDKTPYSLGWLPAQKLRELDLENPPDIVNQKGLAMARDWFATRIQYRQDWIEFKELGPGQPVAASLNKDGESNGESSILFKSL